MDERLKELIHFNDIQSQDGTAITSFVVDPRLPSFEGHFPHEPVLPAVSVIDISLYLIEQLGTPVSFTDLEVKRSKFMDMIRPDHKVQLIATPQGDSEWQVLWLDLEKQSRLAQVNLVIKN